jgi:hypothetical protein
LITYTHIRFVLYSLIIRSQQSPAEHCVSWVHLTTRFMYRRDK